MTTDVDICNLALGRIGVDKTIMSLNEASKEARNCKRFYALCVDEVLEKVPWPFAMKVQALAPLASTTLLPTWGYQYAQPTDCLSLVEVVPAADVDAAASYYSSCAGDWSALRQPPYAFRKALSADGSLPVILSNLPDAYGVYVARVTNTSAYSALMISMLADRIGMELAIPLTLDPRWAQGCAARFERSFADAASRQFEQGEFGPVVDPPSIRARC